MDSRARQVAVAMAGVLAWLSMAASAGPRFAESPCFKTSGAATAQACEQLARDVSHDIGAVRALGDELERGGRYEEAATTYRVALTVHPDHRDLLQRLIRARGQSRSLRLLAAPATESPATAQATGAPAATPTANSTMAGTTTPAAKSAASPAAAASLAATKVAASLTTNASSTQARAAAATSPGAPAQTGRSVATNDATGAVATPAVGRTLDRTASIAPAAAAARSGDSSDAAGTDATGTGRYLALLIGNEQYADFDKLKTPIADTRALAAVLERDYAFSVTVLTNATRYQVVSALSRLRKEATENDNVLIYYAGHGYLDDTTSRGYWLPVDAERDNLANWLSTSDITDVLAGLQARHALILADSCFSGTLLRSDPTVAIDERGSLLKKLATLRSRSIMTSGGLEPVSDNGGGQHSVFAAALLRALRENKQPLEAGRLFMQIRERVALGASQTPQYGPLRNAGHDGGDFIFARNASRTRR